MVKSLNPASYSSAFRRPIVNSCRLDFSSVSVFSSCAASPVNRRCRSNASRNPASNCRIDKIIGFNSRVPSAFSVGVNSHDVTETRDALSANSRNGDQPSAQKPRQHRSRYRQQQHARQHIKPRRLHHLPKKLPRRSPINQCHWPPRPPILQPVNHPHAFGAKYPIMNSPHLGSRSILLFATTPATPPTPATPSRPHSPTPPTAAPSDSIPHKYPRPAAPSSLRSTVTFASGSSASCTAPSSESARPRNTMSKARRRVCTSCTIATTANPAAHNNSASRTPTISRRVS